MGGAAPADGASDAGRVRADQTLDIAWLRQYRCALDGAIHGLPHEPFDCPALCLLVATTQEEQSVAGSTVETLVELSSQPYLSEPYHTGLLDPG